MATLAVTDSRDQIFLDHVLEIVTEQLHFDSDFHGIEHWMRVERNGRWLASKTDGADELVVRAFALIHDSQRVEDGYDVHHGPKAATYINELAYRMGDDWILNKDQTNLLRRACAGHTAAHPDHLEDDHDLSPTIRCCWDADRLDLGRVGVKPDPQYLFTEEGRALAATQEYYALDDMGIVVTAQDSLSPTINPEDAW